jgi:hypothetical protein
MARAPYRERMRLRLRLRGGTATGTLWHEAEKGGSARFEPASGLSKLSLLIQGSAPDGQVRILALADGKVISEGYPVTISNTGWKLVEQPQATLGAEDKVIDVIWIQNASAADLPKFYVTEIKLQ